MLFTELRWIRRKVDFLINTSFQGLQVLRHAFRTLILTTEIVDLGPLMAHYILI